MTPRAYAENLSRFYGQTAKDLSYMETFALLARARLGQREAVASLLSPWIQKDQESLANVHPVISAGHLVFREIPGGAEILEMAGARAARDPKDHEMSDSVFMVCPLLAATGRYEEAGRHFKKMEDYCRRPDGLYRHSPLCEAAWGRGNGFPLIGMALALSDIPSSHSAFSQILPSFQALAAVLIKHQNENGMWHQLIDEPDSTAEFSATALIGTALARGVRRGFLPQADFGASIQKAWEGVVSRTSPTGELRDVCESTGKFPSREDYLKRKMIRGRDNRGGSLALFFAVEML